MAPARKERTQTIGGREKHKREVENVLTSAERRSRQHSVAMDRAAMRTVSHKREVENVLTSAERRSRQHSVAMDRAAMRTVWVGGLPDVITDRTLRTVMAVAGDVDTLNIRLKNGKAEGKNASWALVVYKREDDARRAPAKVGQLRRWKVELADADRLGSLEAQFTMSLVTASAAEHEGYQQEQQQQQQQEEEEEEEEEEELEQVSGSKPDSHSLVQFHEIHGGVDGDSSQEEGEEEEGTEQQKPEDLNRVLLNHDLIPEKPRLKLRHPHRQGLRGVSVPGPRIVPHSPRVHRAGLILSPYAGIGRGVGPSSGERFSQDVVKVVAALKLDLPRPQTSSACSSVGSGGQPTELADLLSNASTTPRASMGSPRMPSIRRFNSKKELHDKHRKEASQLMMGGIGKSLTARVAKHEHGNHVQATHPISKRGWHGSHRAMSARVPSGKEWNMGLGLHANQDGESVSDASPPQTAGWKLIEPRWGPKALMSSTVGKFGLSSSSLDALSATLSSDSAVDRTFADTAIDIGTRRRHHTPVYYQANTRSQFQSDAKVSCCPRFCSGSTVLTLSHRLTVGLVCLAKVSAAMRQMRRDRQRMVELETYRRAFELIDTDKSGTVEPSEVIGLIKRLGMHTNEGMFWDIFHQMDYDNSAQLDFEEFKGVVEQLSPRGPARAAGFGKQGQDPASANMHRHRHKRVVPEGSRYMNETLDVKQQLADVYTAVAQMRQRAIGEGLLTLPPDSRLRTQVGRNMAANEEAMVEAVRTDVLEGNEKLQEAVLSRFAALFADP
jgi:hypothetical protein